MNRGSSRFVDGHEDSTGRRLSKAERTEVTHAIVNASFVNTLNYGMLSWRKATRRLFSTVEVVPYENATSDLSLGGDAVVAATKMEAKPTKVDGGTRPTYSACAFRRLLMRCKMTVQSRWSAAGVLTRHLPMTPQ